MKHPISVQVALLARSPVLGQVKRRLEEDIGATKALECYRLLLLNALEATRPFKTTIWYEGSTKIWGEIAPGHRLKKQPPGDLGHKMLTALNEGAKLVIGADVPLMSVDYIYRALDYIATQQDVVVGPTEDGGYCLIGMNEPCAYLFEHISWGSDRVLEQTLSRAQDLGLQVFLLSKLWDVDTIADYQRWKQEIPTDRVFQV
ncbi:MAG: TIGR04282 family arsenosugar biosynthesis glycosyltransferase [Gammaproteobacteria bacterium]|nr:TIGR04282 family arsenosugar biosynthesis glycosyltransferase [Gammaproteobacteria bacterium]